MGSLLTDRWLGAAQRLHVVDEASVAVVREEVRRQGRVLGLSKSAVAALVNVASELGHNQLAHARGGEIAVRRIDRAGVGGLEVIAADRGAGIASPSHAIQGTARIPEKSRGKAKGGLGIGLAAVIELSDETDFDVRIGEGTCVWARKFSETAPRRRQIGIFGRACPAVEAIGEDNQQVSGDDGTFLRTDDALVLAVADGVGHGEAARQASAAAIDTALSHAVEPVDRILLKCHEALDQTRGAVMAVVRIGEPGDTASLGCVGNACVHVYGVGATRRYSGPSFVLGNARQVPRILVEKHTLAQTDAVALFTDGLTTKTDLEGELDLVLREHPIRIAHQLVERFGRPHDDALAIVAR